MICKLYNLLKPFGPKTAMFKGRPFFDNNLAILAVSIRSPSFISISCKFCKLRIALKTETS